MYHRSFLVLVCRFSSEDIMDGEGSANPTKIVMSKQILHENMQMQSFRDADLQFLMEQYKLVSCFMSMYRSCPFNTYIGR